jgi:haloalkane dehalogenase
MDIDFAKPPEHFVDVGHSRIAHRTLGRGPDVVFIHGWPLHGATYREAARRLADEFTCHLIDLPGTGFTETGADAPIDLLSHATTVRRVVDRLGLKRYALVGHDSGGYVARQVAAGDDRVAGLVLSDTEIPRHHPFLLKVFVVGARVWPGLLMAILRSPRLRRTTLGFGTCFTDPRFVDGEFVELFVRPMLDSPRIAAGQMALLRSLDPRLIDDLEAVHRRLAMPVRLIWGTRDPFFPIAAARRMLPTFAGGADLHEIAGAKLYSHEDHPDEFVASARPFLREALSRGQAARRLG